MKAALLILTATFAVGYSHLCLLFPHQRGTEMDLNKQGSMDCGLDKISPCGDRPGEMPMVTYKAGMNGSIIFQKNLDHFYSMSPGMFEVNITMTEDHKEWKTLMMIPDTSAPSGTLYTIDVVMPMMEMEKAVLQVAYVTNNPQAPAVFYQCADINIRKM